MNTPLNYSNALPNVPRAPVKAKKEEAKKQPSPKSEETSQQNCVQDTRDTCEKSTCKTNLLEKFNSA
jgi:hypothetical protein